MECLPESSKMVKNTDIKVEIRKSNQRIYENTLKNEGNDLNSLISNLKSMQQQVNEILTKLVQAEQSSNQGSNLADNDDGDEAEGDGSEDDDEDTKPKKCKYK